jgi:hypothetical protein
MYKKLIVLVLALFMVPFGACTERSRGPTEPPPPPEMVKITFFYDGGLPLYFADPTNLPGFRRIRVNVGKISGVGTFIPVEDRDIVLSWVSGSLWQGEVTLERGRDYPVRASDPGRAFAERDAGLPYNEQGLYARTIFSEGFRFIRYVMDPISEFMVVKVN